MHAAGWLTVLMLAALLCLASATVEDGGTILLSLQTEGSTARPSLAYEISEFLADVEPTLFFRFVHTFAQAMTDAGAPTLQEEEQLALDIAHDLLLHEERWMELLAYAIRSGYYLRALREHASTLPMIAQPSDCDSPVHMVLHWAIGLEWDLKAVGATYSKDDVADWYREFMNHIADAREDTVANRETAWRTVRVKRAEKDFLDYVGEHGALEFFGKPMCTVTDTMTFVNPILDVCSESRIKCKVAPSHAGDHADLNGASSAHRLGTDGSLFHYHVWGDIRDPRVAATLQELTDALNATKTLDFDFQILFHHQSEFLDSLSTAHPSEWSADVVVEEAPQEMDAAGKAACFVERSADPLKSLSELTSDLPAAVQQLSATDCLISTLPSQASQILLNGQSFGVRPESGSRALFAAMMEEVKLINNLELSGFKEEVIPHLSSLAPNAVDELRVDVHDAVLWLNNVQTDERYKAYDSAIIDVLGQRTLGKFVKLARNVLNVVVVVDPMDAIADGTFKRLAAVAFSKAPFRFGIALQSHKKWPAENFAPNLPRHVLAVAFTMIYEQQGPSAAAVFAASFAAEIIPTSEEILVKLNEALAIEMTLSDMETSVVTERIIENNMKIRLKVPMEALPATFINGVYSKENVTNLKILQKACKAATIRDLDILQRAFEEGRYPNGKPELSFILAEAGVQPAYVPSLVGAEIPTYATLAVPPSNVDTSEAAFYEVKALGSPRQKVLSEFLRTHCTYYGTEDEPASITHIFVLNLSSYVGVSALAAMMDRVAAEEDMSDVRWAIIMSTNPTTYNRDRGVFQTRLANRVAATALVASQEIYNVALEEIVAYERPSLGGTSFHYMDVLSQNGMSEDDLRLITSIVTVKANAYIMQNEHHAQLMSMLGGSIDLGMNYVVTNGRLFDLNKSRPASPAAFRLIEDQERRRNGKLIDFIRAEYAATHSANEVSDLIMKAASVLQQSAPRQMHHSPALLSIRAVVDPLSRKAQLVAPLLLDIRQEFTSLADVFLSLVHDPNAAPATSSHHIFSAGADSTAKTVHLADAQPAIASVQADGFSNKTVRVESKEHGDCAQVTFSRQDDEASSVTTCRSESEPARDWTEKVSVWAEEKLALESKREEVAVDVNEIYV